MAYKSLSECLADLEKHGHLVRIRDEVDAELEMSAVHLRAFAAKGPALLFERVKGTRYMAASNLFGTLERSRFMFRDSLEQVKKLVEIRTDPMQAVRRPWKSLGVGISALSSLPMKQGFPSASFEEIRISDLPLIRHWPKDGGAFVTLPQVYTEDPERPGPMHANLGMYRIQLNGNEYLTDREIGLHYQLHRGIGVHQTKYHKLGKPMKVSVFVGGPPSHTLAAVMPLPEGTSELTFAGALGKRRFRYSYLEGFMVSNDADFVIHGEVHPGENKPEGPFGDHLGYYSLTHPFPLMRVVRVLAKKKAIWPFTVVGRPPQEDTAFGQLIHEISGSAIPAEIPGVSAVHAVDAAGVHPLLLANGSERYTPYLENTRPSELLTQASRILGTGQLSLAKFLFIAAGDNVPDCHDARKFLEYVFERVDTARDLHFTTKTSIDTLDYSGEGLNEGSKVVIAACGAPLRKLREATGGPLQAGRFSMKMLMSGVAGIDAGAYVNESDIGKLTEELTAIYRDNREAFSGIVQIVLYDGFDFGSEPRLGDYLWVTYTRSNPAADIHGVDAFIEKKHWGCRGPMIVDARKKPHHAPELSMPSGVNDRVSRFFDKGGPLYDWR